MQRNVSTVRTHIGTPARQRLGRRDSRTNAYNRSRKRDTRVAEVAARSAYNRERKGSKAAVTLRSQDIEAKTEAAATQRVAEVAKKKRIQQKQEGGNTKGRRSSRNTACNNAKTGQKAAATQRVAEVACNNAKKGKKAVAT